MTGARRPPLVIALDGPAASGKGTLRRRLAEHFGLPELDTGLLYRAIGYEVLRRGGDPADPEAAAEAIAALDDVDLTARALRHDDVAQAASKVAAMPHVRRGLLDFQRRFAEGPRGAVVDGRDIGTVVCPDADVKIFITASLPTRTARRFKELRERGQDVIYAAVLEDMRQRDARDSGRAISPLTPADDAFVLDTSDLSADQVFERALDFIAERTGQR
ncbi:MAG: (d)CMP kinase [Inquilinaceae bacterium]